jgi:xylitol oxidase
MKGSPPEPSEPARPGNAGTAAVRGAVGSNWAGNLRYRARRLHTPSSVDEVRRLVPTISAARTLGSRHSFNDIADTDGDLISLAGLPRVLRIDRAARTVDIDGGARYGDICQPLEQAGLALHALASLPHISVAGACATASHGSGDDVMGLATAVVGLELVTADGDLVTLDRTSHPESFDGCVVSLGALGVVVGLTLAVEPSYRMRQHVYEGLSLDAYAANVETLTRSADSVSAFTRWRRDEGFHQVWLKRRVTDGASPGAPADAPPEALFGATPAQHALHPIPGMSPQACTEQLGVPGPWHERAPHFRLDHTPSSGDELQSEYLVGRQHTAAAVQALFDLGERIAALVQVSEIRTIAADEHWLSPMYRRPSTAIHFTWVPDWPAVREVLPMIEDALAPFGARPHWGKLSTMPAAAIRSQYERWQAFVALVDEFDPAGRFRNPYLERLLG